MTPPTDPLLELQAYLAQLGFDVAPTGEMDAATTEAIAEIATERQRAGLPPLVVPRERGGPRPEPGDGPPAGVTVADLMARTPPDRVEADLPPEIVAGLALGTRGDAVRALQGVLAQLDDRTEVAATGVFDRATARAVSAAQHRVGVGADGAMREDDWIALLGVPTVARDPSQRDTLSRIRPPEAGSAWPILSRGDRGPAVVLAQIRLRHHGADVVADGDFGSLTEDAVRALQARDSLPEDGVVGGATWDVLLADLRPIGVGADATLIRVVQRILAWAVDRPVPATGRFDALTAGALAVYLAAHDLPPAGAVTLPVLASLLRHDATPRLPRVGEGIRGVVVRLVQALLVAQGVVVGIDGDFGTTTARMLAGFQRSVGGPGHAETDPATWHALLADQLPITTGSHPAVVRACQRRLGEVGVGIVGVDGVFGTNSADAVRAIESRVGRTVDGAIDHGDLALLFTDAAWEALRVELRGLAADALEANPAGARDGMAVLDAAIAMLGLAERPRGSNHSAALAPIVEGYWDLPGFPPWCALAVCHWMKEGLGATSWADTPFGARFGATEQIRRWGEVHGCLRSPTDPASPGTVFVMRRSGSGSDPSVSIGAGHTGFVVADLGDGRIRTIEGNVADRVSTRTRDKTSLVGLVTWWAPRPMV